MTPRWGADGTAIVDGCLCSRWGPPVEEMRRRRHEAAIRGAEEWLRMWGPTAGAVQTAEVIARAEEARRALEELGVKRCG